MNRKHTEDRITDADYILYLDPRPEEVANKQVKFDPMAAARGLFWGIVFGACLWIILYWIGEKIR